VNDSHASFDLRFRGKSLTSFAHRLESMPVLGSHWSAWDTSSSWVDELTNGETFALLRSLTCSDDTLSRKKVRLPRKSLRVAGFLLNSGVIFIKSTHFAGILYRLNTGFLNLKFSTRMPN
jgi:hypothetical protein